MYLLRSSLVILLLTCASFAQDAARLDSPDVKRVASRLACQCGSCKSSTACEMPGGCGFCKRIKTKIASMQDAGMSDKQIIDTVVKDNGPQMFLAEPGTWGWITPFLAVAFGLALILWFVRRNMNHPATAGGPAMTTEDVDRYNERIEKDLAKLE